MIVTDRKNDGTINKKRIFPPQGPLTGLRVLDFSQVLATPYLGTMLSDMGAEVIKIEASYGDSARGYGPFKEGESGYLISQNRGKYGLCIDLSKPKATEICKELVKISDILIENWRPGIMKRRGLDYESVRQINPGIIYASISGYGNYDRFAPAPGPYAPRVCYDVVAQADSGHQWMNGFPDQVPDGLDVPWSDLLAGTHEATAIIAALIHRIKTGRGQWIDVGLTDTMVACNENLICAASMADDDIPAPCRNGLRRLSMSPHGVFKAKDNYLVIGIDNDQRFARLCEAIGRLELAHNLKFDTNHHRLQNRQEIESIVEDWCSVRTVDECIKILRDEHHVPAGPILASTEYIKHAHYLSREMLVSVEQTRAGIVNVAGVVPKLSDSPGRVQGAAPLLGEHNRYLLKKYLGYADGDIDKLYDEFIIVDNLNIEYGPSIDIAKAKANKQRSNS